GMGVTRQFNIESRLADTCQKLTAFPGPMVGLKTDPITRQQICIMQSYMVTHQPPTMCDAKSPGPNRSD
ncbi:MAG TPA: hypothetical protein DHC76_14395, partial [Rhodobacteraceae bacterium]|nr:hypothetical protein [Paracoccaceae bacterium]